MKKITSHLVHVNGSIIHDLNYKVTQHDTVIIDKEKITETSLLYYKFNKPIGTISTFNDPNKRIDLSYHLKKNKLNPSLKPCGRLDADSSGLLLFSNDGDFINKILHPKHTITKTYKITLDKPLTPSDKQSLTAGFFLTDGPMKIAFKTTINPTTFIVIISVGRNRILRRSFKYFGYTIIKLHRSEIGKLTLGNLKDAEFEPFDPSLFYD